MSKRLRAPILLSAALAAALLGTALPSAYAGDTAASAAVVSLGQVSLTGSSYAEIKQVNLLSDQNGKIVTFTVSVTNKGSMDLSFIDYWVRLMTKDGAQFTVKMMPQDKDKNVVPAGSTQDLSFYAVINDATALTDLKFRIIKWDFSVDSFERTLGEIPVPDDFSNVTPEGGSQVAKLSGTNIKLSVSKFMLGKNEKYSLPGITLKLENVDSHSLTVPAYQFAVRTQEGYTYPLEAKGLNNLAITPQESKEITLSGSIPASIATEGWQLVMTQSLTDPKLNVPIAFFRLPQVTQQTGSEAGKEVQFTDESGLYTAKLNGTYRLPWEDQDILSADIVLSNGGSDSLPIPALTGYFLLDGAVKVDAKVITPAKVIGLANGASVGMQMAAKIPYTYEFSKAKLVLQEKGSDDKITDVLDFETSADMMNVPIADAKSPFELTDAGYRSKFTVQSVKKYEAQSTQMYMAKVLVENKEKRFANLAKLVANFRAPDGTVYPATIADIKDKAGPGGKALLSVYSVLPKGVSTDNMNLLLGEAVADGKLAASGDDKAADMYTNPFSFWMPKEDTEVKKELKELDFSPYTVSISHVGTSLDTSTLTVKFDYEIKKDASTVTSTEGRKIVFNLEDANGIRSFDWAYDLSSFEPQSGDTPETPQSKLKIGSYKDFKVSMQSSDLIYKLSFLKSYKLNVYEGVNGHRKLLASLANDWFVNSD